MNDLKNAIRDLVAANRVLAHRGVVDAYGQVSVRHPERAGSVRPACAVTSAPGRFFAAARVSVSDLWQCDAQPNGCTPISQA